MSSRVIRHQLADDSQVLGGVNADSGGVQSDGLDTFAVFEDSQVLVVLNTLQGRGPPRCELKEEVPPEIEAYVEYLDLLEKENPNFSPLWKKEFVRLFEDKYPQLCAILKNEFRNRHLYDFVVKKRNSRAPGYHKYHNNYQHSVSKKNGYRR